MLLWQDTCVRLLIIVVGPIKMPIRDYFHVNANTFKLAKFQNYEVKGVCV